ncbi:hypothetical protein ACH5RR_031719 [Cinchona calisaya]|uniref:DOG1 domain-containing protein n=1 Tax=Cinchona calisaya TaxID=153742 RepID=A0ABD2YG28_9GENT
MAGALAFTAFFEGWIKKKQSLLEKLLPLLSNDQESNEELCKELVAEVFAHYQEYYQEKSRAVNEDVFLMLSPPWMNSFERTLLWISEFKPSMVFPLIKNSLKECLTSDQVEKIEEIKAQTKREEKEVEQAMATVQESIAAPPIFELMRRFGRLVDGEISELDEAMEKFKENMKMVVENADALRGSTVRKLMGILSPFQTAKFLAASAQFVVQARMWGSERDAQRSAAAGMHN